MDEEKKTEIAEPREYVSWKPYKTIQEFVTAKSYMRSDSQNAITQEGRQRFIELLMFPEFHVMSGVERAEALGVSEQTIGRWWRQVPDDYMDEALKTARARHARQSFEVDSALMRECKGGNVKAMDLYYRRIEGWVPKQDMELSRGRDKELDSQANFELLKALVAGLSPEQKAELLKEGGAGAIEANVERLEGGGEGGPNV